MDLRQWTSASKQFFLHTVFFLIYYGRHTIHYGLPGRVPYADQAASVKNLLACWTWTWWARWPLFSGLATSFLFLWDWLLQKGCGLGHRLQILRIHSLYFNEASQSRKASPLKEDALPGLPSPSQVLYAREGAPPQPSLRQPGLPLIKGGLPPPRVQPFMQQNKMLRHYISLTERARVGRQNIGDPGDYSCNSLYRDKTV